MVGAGVAGFLGELSEDSGFVVVGVFAVDVCDVLCPLWGCDAVWFFVGCSEWVPGGVVEEWLVVFGGLLLECGGFECGDVDVVPEVLFLVECVVEGAFTFGGVSDDQEF